MSTLAILVKIIFIHSNTILFVFQEAFLIIMGLPSWCLVVALAVSAALSFPKGPGWRQNVPKDKNEAKYQSPLGTLDDDYGIPFQRFYPNLEKTRESAINPGKNYRFEG